MTKSPTRADRAWIAFREKKALELIEWARSCGAEHIVFSHEGLWGLDVDSIGRLSELVDDHREVGQ